MALTIKQLRYFMAVAETGKEIPKSIEEEMRTAYLDYAMSVIVGRALPDVRDGLKPVHRRILYGMNEMGLASNRAYRKSAKIVGEIMGKRFSLFGLTARL